MAHRTNSKAHKLRSVGRLQDPKLHTVSATVQRAEIIIIPNEHQVDQARMMKDNIMS